VSLVVPDIWVNSNPYQQLPINPLTEYFSGIAYGNNIFVVVGGATTVVTTHDGITWARQTALSDLNPAAVTYVNNTFIAVGSYNGGRIMSSPDGTNWTSRYTIPTVPHSLVGICYGNGLYVAAGSGGVATSPDIINWTTINLATLGDTAFNDVTYGNNLFITVTANGTALTSPDGITWSRQYPPGFGGLGGITYGNNTFVAVGWAGKIVTSPDGTNWTSRTSGTSVYLSQVKYANGTFVVVGNNGTFVTSVDGVNWVARNTATTQNLLGVAFGNNTFLAAGGNGTLIPLGNSFSPLIAVQPASQTRTEGDTVTFTIAANGAASTYQWQFNGTALPNETNATLTLQTVNTNQAGNYTVTVQNSSALQISQAATLTVNHLPMSPILTASSFLNALQFNIADEIGRNYRVQASTDLVNWADLTNYYSTNTTMLFKDSSTTNFARRFYRVVSP
jgi:hypothetical protein